jgi:hypothetical protein
MIDKKRMLERVALVACCATALALGGCVWGQVTDAVTGEPIVGATVTFRDGEGNVGTVTTGEGGLYSFDGITSPKPVSGRKATFVVSAPGYRILTVERDIQYDDNEEGTWEIEHFFLVPGGG